MCGSYKYVLIRALYLYAEPIVQPLSLSLLLYLLYEVFLLRHPEKLTCGVPFLFFFFFENLSIYVVSLLSTLSIIFKFNVDKYLIIIVVINFTCF